jgi:hypothetical protein
MAARIRCPSMRAVGSRHKSGCLIWDQPDETALRQKAATEPWPGGRFLGLASYPNGLSRSIASARLPSVTWAQPEPGRSAVACCQVTTDSC